MMHCISRGIFPFCTTVCKSLMNECIFLIIGLHFIYQRAVVSVGLLRGAQEKKRDLVIVL